MSDVRELAEELRDFDRRYGWAFAPGSHAMLVKAADALERFAWRQIEAAPEDGSVIELCGPNVYPVHAFLSIDTSLWTCATCREPLEGEYTHFRQVHDGH